MDYTGTAKGTFDVTLTPESREMANDVTFGKFNVQKEFQGGLNATSKVEMLSATSNNGSGAYVAIERVEGTLDGRQGTFVLMHNGTRTKTSQQLIVTVVPGCGTEELENITGTMNINIVDKVHYYEFNYSL
jgi:hypothetical protein